MTTPSSSAELRVRQQSPTSGEVIGGCDPLIQPLTAPYTGMRLTALDVQCPYCNAAPCEPCRSQSVAENAPGATYSVTVGVAYRRTKRPHPERADAARRGQVRA